MAKDPVDSRGLSNKRQRKETAHDAVDSKSSASRRRLLTAIAAGGGVTASATLPGKWAEPVVNSVLLPAHAATSIGDPCQVSISSPNGNDLVANVTGFVFGSQDLSGIQINISVQLTLNGAPVGTPQSTSTTTTAAGTYAATLNFPAGCADNPNGAQATIMSPAFPETVLCTTIIAKGICQVR